MTTTLKINPDYDICLIPYSSVCEKDILEIRAQGYNDGNDGDYRFEFRFDGEIICSKTVNIEKNTYGFASCRLPMHGLAGKHTVSVNGAEVELEVMKERSAKLDGGFVMLGPPNDRKPCDTFRDELKKFTDDDWKNYISALHSIGQDCFIINVAHQYLTLENKELVSHYPSKLMDKSDIAAVDPIDAILSEAEKNSQKVFIGVGNQFGHKGTLPEMTELYERYKHFKSFYGWYFATELRMDFADETRLAKWQLYNYLYEHAKTLSPVKPILISPMGMPCEGFAEYFEKVTFCDIIMPQDWVGQCAFHISDSEEMHRRLAEICSKTGKHLWANCESFNFTDTPDGKWENWGCTFKEFRWDAPRVLVPRFRGGGMIGEQGFDKQLEAVCPYVEKIMTFMFTGFFCPPNFTPRCGGDTAVKQFETYADYVKTLENSPKLLYNSKKDT